MVVPSLTGVKNVIVGFESQPLPNLPQMWLQCSPHDSRGVFTDGSKTNDEVGASTSFPDSTLSHTLPSCSPMFTAELVAIVLTISRLSALNTDDYSIISNSKNVLLALKNKSRNLLVFTLQNYLDLAQHSEENSRFAVSHVMSKQIKRHLWQLLHGKPVDLPFLQRFNCSNQPLIFPEFLI